MHWGRWTTILRVSRGLKGELARQADAFAELNPRQIALSAHAIANPEHAYTIQGHQRSHGTVYQTARTDLLSLVDLGPSTQGTQGRQFVFTAGNNLRNRLQRGSSPRSSLAALRLLNTLDPLPARRPQPPSIADTAGPPHPFLAEPGRETDIQDSLV